MTNTKTSKADKIGEAAATSPCWDGTRTPCSSIGLTSSRSRVSEPSAETSSMSVPPSGGKFWRLQPVATPTIPQGTALVFDRSPSAIFDRETIGVQIGTMNDQFTRNMRTVLVEGRFGFAFFAASAIKRVGF